MSETLPLYRVCIEPPLTPAQSHRAAELALAENAANKAASPAALRAGAETGKLWKPGRVLRVTFLDRDDDPRSQEAVKRYAAKWTHHCSIRFIFGKDDDAEIRISFGQRGASWSYVGTDCLLFEKGPTMNFGWFDVTTDETEYARTILHEFGHALGLFHEHQNPSGKIRWNQGAVYDYYKRVAGWSEEKVKRNILKRYEADQSQYTAFDHESIMLYPIPAELTEDGFTTGSNSDLSKEDKAFIARVYPPLEALPA